MSVNRLPTALSDFEIKNVDVFENSLDVGVFGTSYEGLWLGAPCAVKKLVNSDAKDGYISDRFVYECKIWCELKHPNIIQFFGIYFSPKENRPMLVCELQHDSLSKFLNSKKRETFPLCVKASILKDVALAMCYLHSLDPIVLYRDLNASYIYLTASLTAKLGDFGSASKLQGGKTATLPPTGKTDWPEPFCSASADTFTYGELILHVLVHEFPKPSPKVMDGHKDKTIVLKEFDRRKSYISTLSTQEKHFLPLIARCLQDEPDSRPNFTEIVENVSTCLTFLNADGAKDLKALKLLNLLTDLGAKEKELYTSKVELARLRMSLTSIVMGGEDVSRGQSPMSPRLPPRKPTSPGNKTTSLQHHSLSSLKTQGEPPTTSLEKLMDQGYVSVSPSVRGSLASNMTSDTSEDEYLEMNGHPVKPVPKPKPRPRGPPSPPPQSAKPSVLSKQPLKRKISSHSSSSISSNPDEGIHSPAPKEAIVKKDYKTLKFADRVTVLKWMPESCLVRTETNGNAEYIPSEYLAEVKPIENEIWFTRMSRDVLEYHMRKPYMPTGSYVVREGRQGYVLVLKYGGRPHSYQIFETSEGTYSLNSCGTPNYVTISELIKSYTSRLLGLVTQMTLPYVSQRSEISRESLKMDKEIYQGKRFTIWFGSFTGTEGVTKPTAIKTITLDEQRQKDNSSALYAELSALNCLQRLGPHPNIVKLYGVCSWLNQPYLAMEFCDESNLLQFVRKYAPNLNTDHLLGYLAQIASAMAFVEDCGILHRGPKASSVLVDGSGICKLSGFRQSCTLAKAKDPILARIYTASNDPRWIAPEVLSSYGTSYTSKSEVWSFGIIMVELFSRGSLPYEDISDEDIAVKVADGVSPRLPGNTSSEVHAIMKNCFNLNPTKRPSFSSLEGELSSLVA